MTSAQLASARPKVVEDVPTSNRQAEHCILSVAPDAAPPLNNGARVLLVPAYSDSTTLLHRKMVGVRGGDGRDPSKMLVEVEFDMTPSLGALC